MPFNSFNFVLFFLAVLIVHSLPLPRPLRKLSLLAASYLFYATWESWFIALLVYSTAVNWIAGKLLAVSVNRPHCRRGLLWAAIILNLGLLAIFKYGNELLAMSQIGTTRLEHAYTASSFKILLPIGLSFFTFQSLSYTIDVYRGTVKPAESFIDFAIFIAFFPVLLAGPLLRAGHFLPQCARIRRATGSEFALGMALFTLGIFMKVTLADHLLAPIVQQVYDPALSPDAISAWTGTLAFAGQDYCDFAGYSTCAMGIGYCLGFTLPANFRAPLASIGFRDLWQRWHITLVAWMRDYVFQPLGGIYKGYARAAVNVMIVMLLIGLWHGASSMFLIFGFLQGAYLVGEILIQRTPFRRLRVWAHPVGKFFVWALTIGLCMVSFVFYRAATLDQSWRLLGSLFGTSNSRHAFHLSDADLIIAAVCIESLVIAHWLFRSTPPEVAVARVPWWTVSIGLALMLLAITLSAGESENFIYFQF
jgi:alginate O-acetyltransferase complex protein AlgI